MKQKTKTWTATQTKLLIKAHRTAEKTVPKTLPETALKTKLQTLFKKYPTVPIQYLGIPSDGKGNMLDWENENIWK